MIYNVKIKNTTYGETVRAKNELEAKTKFCDKQGFNYIVFANKIHAEPKKRTGKNE